MHNRGMTNEPTVTVTLPESDWHEISLQLTDLKNAQTSHGQTWAQHGVNARARTAIQNALVTR